MRKNTRNSDAKAALARQAEGIDVLAELAALKAMTVPELQGKWRAMFGEPAPNASRENLELRIGYRIQELAHGGIKPATRRTLDALAAEVASGAPGPLIADPRRPIPGTKLVREWEGEEKVVTVLTDGFEWQGRRFKSLSAAVRAITGSHWNGWKFFGLAHGAEGEARRPKAGHRSGGLMAATNARSASGGPNP
ncbi:DUF2924 domain-containing protein [Tabrizicola sp. YIM 78059]|uniref:DUF2924 domain-containing protein n=1 Tax=Tabrizicola sp. YIM 78059 TaxID=2529861 RepID=UPI0010AB02E3